MLLRKIEIALCSRCIETSTSVGATFKNFVFYQISPCFFFFDTRTCLRDNELTLRLEIVSSNSNSAYHKYRFQLLSDMEKSFKH